MINAQIYQADGQTKSITYANGVTTTFTYNVKRRWLDRIVTKDVSNVVLLDNDYTSDLKIARSLKVIAPLACDNWTI